MGSSDRKSRGRGQRGSVWKVQCKQSQLLIIPAHVRNWTYFDVFPLRPLRPPIPRSQTAAWRAKGEKPVQIVASDTRGARRERGSGRCRGGIQYLLRHGKGGRRNVKWCRVNCWPAVIRADASWGTSHRSIQHFTEQNGRKCNDEKGESQDGFSGNRWSFNDVLKLGSGAVQRINSMSISRQRPENSALCQQLLGLLWSFNVTLEKRENQNSSAPVFVQIVLARPGQCSSEHVHWEDGAFLQRYEPKWSLMTWISSS